MITTWASISILPAILRTLPAHLLARKTSPGNDTHTTVLQDYSHSISPCPPNPAQFPPSPSPKNRFGGETVVLTYTSCWRLVVRKRKGWVVSSLSLIVERRVWASCTLLSLTCKFRAKLPNRAGLCAASEPYPKIRESCSSPVMFAKVMQYRRLPKTTLVMSR